ncbi:MAG: DTW domain-containing protein [Myxococcales bacterium]|nr:DTW domain-containing protein [Myxococcales bacterium]
MGEAPLEPRSVCLRCRRPTSVCYCRHLASIPTRTRVVFLQHPRERTMAIGTARMASLCLPNSELHVGARWDAASGSLGRALSDPDRPAALLYPGEGAIDIISAPPSTPITLVVVDGTWSQAKKIVRHSPILAGLPRYAFVPPAPSEYRIRREPRDDYVSTIEALVHVLGALEGDAARFAPLLTPFRAMIDTQIEHIEQRRSPRARINPRPPRVRPQLPEPLRARPADVVCVFGDANGWPHDSPRRGRGGLADLLRWVAIRPATGEVFAATIAPLAELAAGTSDQVGLPAAELLAGSTHGDFVDQWSAFVRPDDVLCAWGDHSLRLLASVGALGDRTAIDLRQVAAMIDSRRPGSVEQYHRGAGLPEPTAIGPGRAARRVAQLAAILEHMRTRA